MPENWLEDARRRSVDALVEIRSGTILAKPSDPSKCRFCDFLDVCRVAPAAAAEIGAEIGVGEGA
jgi:hypothetical protein